MLTHFVVNVVIVKDNHVLLEKTKGGFWKLPGGHVEKDENPIETLEREVSEELGISIKVLSEKPLFNEGPKAHSLPAPFEVFIHHVSEDEDDNSPHNNIGLVYVATTRDNPKSLEGQDLKWFSREDLGGRSIILPVSKLAIKGLDLNVSGIFNNDTDGTQ